MFRCSGQKTRASDAAQMSPLGCYEAGATRSWLTGSIQKSKRNRCAWLDDGRAMALDHEGIAKGLDKEDGQREASRIPQSELDTAPAFRMREIGQEAGKTRDETMFKGKRGDNEYDTSIERPTQAKFCKKMCELLPTKCRGEKQDLKCTAALTDPKYGPKLAKDNKKFCKMACKVGYQALLTPLARYSCESICKSYLESTEDRISRVAEQRKAGLVKCCSRRRLHRGKDGRFTCQVDMSSLSSKSGTASHVFKSNGPDATGDKTLYKLQFPHVYNNKRTQFARWPSSGLKKALACLVQRTLQIATSQFLLQWPMHFLRCTRPFTVSLI